MLPINTWLGELAITKIYEYMDGPKLFLARSKDDQQYLVYWCDQEKTRTGWLYLPISQERLGQLESKEISLYQAYAQPESGYLLVYTAIPPLEDVVIDDLTSWEHLFPPEGFYIEHIDQGDGSLCAIQ